MASPTGSQQCSAINRRAVAEQRCELPRRFEEAQAYVPHLLIGPERVRRSVEEPHGPIPEFARPARECHAAEQSGIAAGFDPEGQDSHLIVIGLQRPELGDQIGVFGLLLHRREL